MENQDSLYLNISNTVGAPLPKKDKYITFGKHAFHKKYVLLSVVAIILLITVFIIFFTQKKPSVSLKKDPEKKEEIIEEDLRIVNIGQIQVPLDFNKCKDKSFISQFIVDENTSTGILEAIGAKCTDGTFIQKIGNQKGVSSFETSEDKVIGFTTIRVFYSPLDGYVTGFQLYDTANPKIMLASLGKTDNQEYTELRKCGDKMSFSGIRMATNQTNGKIAALDLLCKKI